MDDKYNGNGTLCGKNGEIFECEFKDGKPDGLGRVTLVNGDVYIGNFVNGKICDQVSIKYKNGESYDGYYKDNKKWGYGCFNFKNGDTYVGDFENDLFNGEGILTKTNGEIEKGIFKNGVLEKKLDKLKREEEEEKYKSITYHHYKKSVGGLIVYDITKRSTFENVKNWYNDLIYKAEKGCIIALIGNKLDLVEKNGKKREVSKEEENEKMKSSSLNLSVPRFIDFLVHKFYSKCCGYSSKHILINSCNDIVAKYTTIENILYNQMKLECLWKDYKWNNPQFEKKDKEDLLLDLKEK